MHLSRTAQVLCRNPIPTQIRCVTGTTQGISQRFGAFGQWRSPTTAVTQGLSLLYPVNAGQFMNPKHITAGSPLEGIPSQTLLVLLSSSFSHSLDGTNMDQANDFHSVLGSQDVHTQGHFQHHLFLPEISFTSTVACYGRDSNCGATETKFILQAVLDIFLPGCESARDFPSR